MFLKGFVLVVNIKQLVAINIIKYLYIFVLRNPLR
jgi:hypothetical protein